MWKLIIFKHLHILLAVFFNCAQTARLSCEPNLAHGPSASNLWFVYQRGVKGILADGEWESLVANLSLKRKPNKTTMGRSPGLWERGHPIPSSCRKQPACQRSPVIQEHPQSLACPVNQQFSQRQEPFKAILPIWICSSDYLGEYTNRLQ